MRGALNAAASWNPRIQIVHEVRLPFRKSRKRTALSGSPAQDFLEHYRGFTNLGLSDIQMGQEPQSGRIDRSDQHSAGLEP